MSERNVKANVERLRNEISELRLQSQTDKKKLIQLQRRQDDLLLIIELYKESKSIDDLTVAARELLPQVEEDSNKLRQLISVIQRYLNVSAVQLAAGDELKLVLEFADKLSSLHGEADRICTNAARLKETKL